ncbi:MAG: hybrid sensor histidine kinase/response regulator [Comamonadaceae bacterium]|nr:MAG: hybrid sensor histidine kinase/response regulator [Comamonadaceae bacterium]
MAASAPVIKVRTHLLLMVAAVLLPAAAFSAAALAMLLQSERESAHRSVHETAKFVSLAVDGELSRAESSLRLLATSEKLARGELQSFHERLSRGQFNTATWTLLTDAQGKLLLNSRVPYGTPLPVRTDPSQIPVILATTQATVSDMFIGAHSRRQIVTVNVPVHLPQGDYVLSQAFLPEFFSNVLAQARPPSNWIIGLFDSQSVSIARTHRADELVGKPVNAQLYRASRQAAVGELRHISREGVEVFDVFSRSPVSGWTVAVGVPIADIDAPSLRAVSFAALGLIATLLFGTWLALRNGARLAGSISGAANAAAMIGRGDVPAGKSLRLKELDQLHEAMQKAHIALVEEKEARASAEAGRQVLFISEQAARADAESQNKAKDAFLAMLGHELRNPLSAISGAVKVVKLHGGVPAVSGHAMEVIDRQSGHLANIVDDLLDVSRVMSGKIRLDRRPIDLSTKVRRVLATLEAAGRTQRHTVELDLQEAWVDADITRLDQIVSNLLVNAFKYTPDGGVITVTVRVQGDESVLTVADTGVGIDAALLPQIFDIFVQATPSLDRAQGGLGVGLALVRQLMLLHGARIVAESDGPGRGSRFTAAFQRIEPPAAVQAQREPEELRPMRILVIEDHADARDTLCDLLQLSGHAAEGARDGPEGIFKAAAGQPDVAIVDIGLPGLSGYEVAARLRGDEVTRHIRLIALTGYGQEQDRQLALEAGFDTHLVKPVNAELLFKALEELQALGPQ